MTRLRAKRPLAPATLEQVRLWRARLKPFAMRRAKKLSEITTEQEALALLWDAKLLDRLVIKHFEGAALKRIFTNAAISAPKG